VVPMIALTIIMGLVLSACGRTSTHETGLTWNGTPLVVTARLESPQGDTLKSLGWEALVNHPPTRLLRVEAGEWGDSLSLLEYPDEVASYTAFQQLTPDPDAVAVGEAVCGDRVCFRRGRWIGALDAWSWKGGEWFAGKLELPGTVATGNLPEIFGSLLHQDRLPGSERVLTGEFMGRSIKVPVYAMKVDCRGDTALLYAAPGLQVEFAEGLASLPGWGVDTLQGLWSGLQIYSELIELPPVILRFSGHGMVGVEGCFDKDLTEYWLKMQARGLKNLK
jgi:hypothetical protein